MTVIYVISSWAGRCAKNHVYITARLHCLVRRQWGRWAPRAHAGQVGLKKSICGSPGPPFWALSPLGHSKEPEELLHRWWAWLQGGRVLQEKMLGPNLSRVSYTCSSSSPQQLPRGWGGGSLQPRACPGEGAQLWALDSLGLGGSTSHCPLHCLISKYLRNILVRFLI